MPINSVVAGPGIIVQMLPGNVAKVSVDPAVLPPPSGVEQMSGWWVPELRFSGVEVAEYANRSGRWIKTGNVVTVTFQIGLKVKGSAAGLAGIWGLVHQAKSGTPPWAASLAHYGSLNLILPAATPLLGVASNGNAMSIQAPDGGGGCAILDEAAFNDNSEIMGSVTYEVEH